MTIDPPFPPPSPVTKPERKQRFWEKHLRREVQYLLDLGLLVGAFALAYLLRFDFAIPIEYQRHALVQLPFVVLLEFTALLFYGAYRFVWRYIGIGEIRTFFYAAGSAAMPLMIMRLGLSGEYEAWRIPLSVIVINVILSGGGLLALRIARRALHEQWERSSRPSVDDGNGTPKRILLVGAGQAGVLAVREIRRRGDRAIELAGFVDDDPAKAGSIIHGLKVIGSTQDIPELVPKLRIDRVVITIAVAPSEAIRKIVENCERVGVRVQITPGLFEILEGRVSISRFRDLQIEDLLGREPVQLDLAEMRALLADKVVMVTGAGGSIGSELCRQAARFRPRRLILVERFEGNLFEIDREMHQLWPDIEIEAVVADVGDSQRMEAVFRRGVPDLLFHAAAHKHVPMMETNVVEAVKNNILATAELGRLAGEAGIATFVLISTDKAVRPSSIMGVTKRVAELVTQDLDRRHSSTRFVTVRFGNVLGSAGSVVPTFRRQIEQGGPITVTHPDATRYFMTIPEAAQLVLEAAALGVSGEILILDMGAPVRILDLARDMISLAGAVPERDIPIVFTGLRPGEKLREELNLSDEVTTRKIHPKIFVGRVTVCPDNFIRQTLERLTNLSLVGDDGELRSYLAQIVPESNLELRQAEANAATTTGPMVAG